MKQQFFYNMQTLADYLKISRMQLSRYDKKVPLPRSRYNRVYGKYQLKTMSEKDVKLWLVLLRTKVNTWACKVVPGIM